jgi:hypothetical protein
MTFLRSILIFTHEDMCDLEGEGIVTGIYLFLLFLIVVN